MSIGRKIKLKNSELKGKVVGLYLAKNKNFYRPNDLWWVEWDNGSKGIIELERDIEL